MMAKRSLSSRALAGTICLLGIGLFLLDTSTDGVPGSRSTPEHARQLTNQLDEAIKSADWPPASVVDAVADEMNRVVVTSVNCGYLDMADNWAASLLKHGVENFIFVPLDETAYKVLNEAYPGHVVPIFPGLPSNLSHKEADGFFNEAFKLLTAFRPAYLHSFLEKGYKILYNDVDMVWNGKALDDFADLEEDGAKDQAVFVKDNNSQLNSLCSCLIYMMPTWENQYFLQRWREEILTGDHANDQPAFNRVFHDHFGGWSGSFPVRLGDDKKFPAGNQYFGAPNLIAESFDEEKKKEALVIHNNWIHGKQKKIDRWKEHGFWNPSGKLTEYTCE